MGFARVTAGEGEHPMLILSDRAADRSQHSFFFREIMQEVAKIWKHGAVWLAIRRCFRAFVGDVRIAFSQLPMSFDPNIRGVVLQAFPQVINWTLYPITVIVDSMYEQVRTAYLAGTRVNPYVVDMLSQFDRVINFAHTGSPKVLMRGPMNHTWLSLGILANGYPSLFLGCQIASGTFLGIIPASWPVDDRNRPLISSARAQELKFGKKHFMVSCLHLPREPTAVCSRTSFCKNRRLSVVALHGAIVSA